ncbi:MAG: CYTH domain-containing protein [Loktanella sp.]|nr:CYTH domain-containing protein [Loktanella sp.]
MTSTKQSVEIERKFLIRELPPLAGLTSTTIQQGYFTKASDSLEVRLRRRDTEHFLTVKSPGTVQRSEIEVAISGDQFEELWPATEGRRIEKIRYVGKLTQDLTFELDIFSGRLAPLVVVEVEFPTLQAAQAFAPPSWFGRDVSADIAFKGKTLAMCPSHTVALV